MTPITALGSRYGIQGALGRSVKRASTASTWWDLNGTITSCVAAYQPKGAASYAASKVNLTGNTDYDAADGAAYPSWNATDGWAFVGTSSQYLKTGFQATSGNKYSGIVRFSDGSLTDGEAIQFLFAGRDMDTASRFYIVNNWSATIGNRTYGWSGTNYATLGHIASGVMCNAAGKGYLNGSYEVGSESTLTATSRTIYIGCQNGGSGTSGDTALNFETAKIQAIAFYSAALTPEEVANLTTAMNAL